MPRQQPPLRVVPRADEVVREGGRHILVGGAVQEGVPGGDLGVVVPVPRLRHAPGDTHEAGDKNEVAQSQLTDSVDDKASNEELP